MSNDISKIENYLSKVFQKKFKFYEENSNMKSYSFINFENRFIIFYYIRKNNKWGYNLKLANNNKIKNIFYKFVNEKNINDIIVFNRKEKLNKLHE